MKRKLYPPPTRLAVVLVSVLMLLTACSEIDKTFINPLGSQLYGLWYADYQASGTIGSDNIPYSRVLQAVKLNSDGTGTWWRAVFADDDASKPLYLYGGRYVVNGTFDYTVAADGTITAKRRGEKQLDGSPMTLTFHFADGVLTTQDGGATQTLAVAPKDYDNVLLALENSMQGASADNYNINDAEITAENWRQQEAIYIYDGVGADVKDEKGRTGYTLVNLPWYKGDKLTNLPDGFCDDITPEMGWEWVLNRCGSRVTVNNNFFAVYNKYTGILRFFYYMPQGTNTGNDHVWQVSMTDNLATRSTIPYGVPTDRTFSNKAAINQTGQGTFMEYVTPWTDYLSQDGLIVPNAGWWAFDVDMSLTRPEALAEDNNIKLQMRSWNTNHTSLYSTMLANIDGEMKASIDGQAQTVIKAPVVASSSKGLFGRIGDFVKLGTKVKDAVTNLYSGNVVGAIKGGIDLAKNGSSLASGKIPASGGGTTGTAETTFEASLNGTLNMMMNGTINTDGVIKGSAPTVGVASPTFYLKDFDTKNSHLGQGVWNLKKTPMVYGTNSQNIVDYWPHTNEYFTTNWLFFDPSSIEVELNPNIFPEDEIEWMQVDAIAGARKEMPWKGTDPFRQAIGLKPIADYKFESYNGSFAYERKGDDINNYVFNFVGAGDFDGQTIEGTNFPISCAPFESGYTYYRVGEYYKVWPRVFGSGTEDYIIEPQTTGWEYIKKHNSGKKQYIEHNPSVFPAVEINVSVLVKLKSLDAPILLSRIYLPDFQYLEILKDEAKVQEVLDRILAKKNLSPKTKGHTQSYDFQAARINKCFKLLMDYQNISTFAAENKRWTTWYSDQYTYVIATEGADAYTAEYNAEKSCMILHKLGKVVPKGMSVVIVADANVASVFMNSDNNAAAPQNIPNNSLNGANTVSPVADIIKILKGRVDGAQGGTVYVLRQGDNGFGYYPYTDTNMTEHTSFLFIADVQYPGGAQPAFVSVAFE